MRAGTWGNAANLSHFGSGMMGDNAYVNNPFLVRRPPPRVPYFPLLGAASPQPPQWNAPMASDFQTPYTPQQSGTTMPMPTFF
jgi:hypothetical protein